MLVIDFVKASTEPNPDGTADEEKEQSTEKNKQQKSAEPKQVGS